MTQLLVIAVYLALLLGLGLFSNRLSRGTSQDYMLASHSIGPVLLLLSLFGTTMTAFALVGSTGEAWQTGIGVFGMLASASGILHSACFFLVGVKLWSFGRRYGYSTQIQFFRERLESNGVGLLLFPVLIALVIPYIMLGIYGAGAVIQGSTRGLLASGAGLPSWAGAGIICLVVFVYVFFGGMRGTAWANALQTLVFMGLGVVTFVLVAYNLGDKPTLLESMQAATARLLETDAGRAKLTRDTIPDGVYAAFLLIPLSVAMFPHVFQHWLTARSSAAFKLPIVAHPIFILIVWLPCVMMGTWAFGAGINPPVDPSSGQPNINLVLAMTVNRLGNPLVEGLLTAGILAAIMSSLDSQFLCIGTMFTHDIVLHYSRRETFSDRRKVLLARSFIVAIVAVSYLLSLFPPRAIFSIAIWCFSGFTGLFPLVFAAIYWRRLTKAGAAASILTTIAVWAVLFYRSNFGLPAPGKPPYRFPEEVFWGIPPMMPVVTITVASTVALILVSLVTRPPSEQTLARFFPAR